MSETPRGNYPDTSLPGGVQPPREVIETSVYQSPSPHEVAGELREAQRSWLERRGLPCIELPPMDRRAFYVLGQLPLGTPGERHFADDVMRVYGIPNDDQSQVPYVLVDIVPDDPSLPHDSKLMATSEEDFGTTLDSEEIDKDFQNPDAPSPENPSTPPSHNAYHTVDISHSLIEQEQALQTFATKLMAGQKENPFSSSFEDIGIRAGGLAPGQKDAFVWDISPITNSIALTLSFPSRYTSVCVVRGQKRPPVNGKVGMAQIENPVETLRIDGENLRELQEIYKTLYLQPSFALTKEQRLAREGLLNIYLVNLITEATSKNYAEAVRQEQAKAADRRRRAQPLQERRLPLP